MISHGDLQPLQPLQTLSDQLQEYHAQSGQKPS